ncbi:arginine kinase-like isoform X2 [Apis laboriosa]|nr:arginine kinase-like isoform X2 [Apis laboriosa]XP_043786743.1 arginine kinase-like isoform X2 [Apis laboriosa]XP_043786752.1 arginine kinase-like isoform X2 [Apis laboriosa]XP_043786761.1 arginine kinase-like isoform X2 [Apis laboriosa]
MCDKRLCACERKVQPGFMSPFDDRVKALDEAYENFSKMESQSLLKKHLTRQIFNMLKSRLTNTESSLMDVIQSGLKNLDSNIGIYAPDQHAYTVFAPLFNPVIEEYHKGFTPEDVHPLLDWGDPDKLGNLDPGEEFIISTRIRCARSVNGYPLNPTMTKSHYQELETKLQQILNTLEDELKGNYYSLIKMDKITQQQLIDDHFLFKEGDRFLEAANAIRFWPVGRGIFYNDSKTFLVWCNEEDHLRLISMQKGGDLAAVYSRLVKGATELGKKIPFSRHRRLGYLTFCPTNLGTTIRASVHARFPKLNDNPERFHEIANMYNLQIRGTRGEHTEGEEGIFDISNKRRLGLTENEVVSEMRIGILELIKEEKRLQESE